MGNMQEPASDGTASASGPRTSLSRRPYSRSAGGRRRVTRHGRLRPLMSGMTDEVRRSNRAGGVGAKESSGSPPCRTLWPTHHGAGPISMLFHTPVRLRFSRSPKLAWMRSITKTRPPCCLRRPAADGDTAGVTGTAPKPMAVPIIRTSPWAGHGVVPASKPTGKPALDRWPSARRVNGPHDTRRTAGSAPARRGLLPGHATPHSRGQRRAHQRPLEAPRIAGLDVGIGVRRRRRVAGPGHGAPPRARRSRSVPRCSGHATRPDRRAYSGGRGRIEGPMGRA